VPPSSSPTGSAQTGSSPTGSSPDGRPAGRYGDARGPRRTAGVVGLAVLGAALLAYLVWVAWSHANPAVRAGLLSYDIRGDRSVEVVLEVVRSPGQPVTCEVRAQNLDNVTVGTARADVDVAAPRHSRLTLVVATTERAVNGELVRCTEIDAG
jgi:hypothetical protein